MLLAIDIGNLEIIVGCFARDQLLFTERLSTSLKRTELEYMIDLKMILDLYEISIEGIEGSSISSVVPQLTPTIRQALAKLGCEEHCLLVTPDLPTNVPLHIDTPKQIGCDLLVAAVAAVERYGAPLVLVQFGTATVLSVIDKDGCYIGGSILPGVQGALHALVRHTAQLPSIHPHAPKRVTATNTVDSMKSGIIFGNASAIDGMLERIWEQLGTRTQVIAMGEQALQIIPHCKASIEYDPTLRLHGLYLLYHSQNVRGCVL